MKNELLRVTNISKKFGNIVALDNVSLCIPESTVYALLGKNGAGKSTLIHILTGSLVPDKGQVSIRNTHLEGMGIKRITHAQSLGMGVVYQELSVIDYLSVMDNMFLGKWYTKNGIIDKKRASLELRNIFDDLHINIDVHALLINLSPPKRQLIEISKAIIQKPQLLILDEPTSSLGIHEVEILFRMIRKIKKNKSSIIYVSHRMSEIYEIADTIGIMRDGKLVSEVEQKNSSIEKTVNLMVGEENKKVHMHISESEENRIKEPALKVTNICIKPKIENVSFTLHKGEIVGIAGLLGSGRTEILEAIAGLRKIDGGTVELMIDKSLKDITACGFLKTKMHGIGFVSEDRKKCGIVPNLSVEENVIVTNMAQVSTCSVINSHKVKKDTMRIASEMDIKFENTKVNILCLSGGNQQKVVIGKWFYADCKVLLLDEPTRGVDIKSKTQIYKIVQNWVRKTDSSVIVVSSEIEELPLLCDRIVILNKGRIINPPVFTKDADALLTQILKEG